ncbi:hypothetical protein AABB24_037176, partial [Solanum stoloniferum]
ARLLSKMLRQRFPSNIIPPSLYLPVTSHATPLLQLPLTLSNYSSVFSFLFFMFQIFRRSSIYSDKRKLKHFFFRQKFVIVSYKCDKCLLIERKKMKAMDRRCCQ